MIDIVRYIETLRKVAETTGGLWVVARPSSQIVLTRRQRLRDAIAVFRGQADAVKWPGQGEIRSF